MGILIGLYTGFGGMCFATRVRTIQQPVDMPG